MKRFFLAPESPRPLALIRIGVTSVLLHDAAVRWPFSVELYSANGFPDPPFSGTWLEPAQWPALPTVFLHSVLIFALAAAAVGWRTRLSLLVAFCLEAYVGLLDGAGTFKKYSVIGLHLLLLLSCSGCGRAWSVDESLRPDRRSVTHLAAAWPRRLMQILVCAVYLGAAVTKLRFPDFISGDLLQFSLLDNQWGGGPLGHRLAMHSWLLAAASWAVLLYELAFPLWIWLPRLRGPVLLVGLLFHLTLGCLMQLGVFSAVMIVALLSFVDERWLPCFPSTKCSRLPWGVVGHKSPAFSLIAYCSVGITVAGFGAAVQWRADWYGVFGIRGLPRYELISEDQAREMLSGRLPAYEDYLHRLEIGSHVALARVWGERRSFRRGATVHALARFIRDRPELTLDWLLIDPQGEEVARISKPLARDFTHARAGFRLGNDLPTGDYRIILQADGYEIARAAFVVRQ